MCVLHGPRNILAGTACQKYAVKMNDFADIDTIFAWGRWLDKTYLGNTAFNTSLICAKSQNICYIWGVGQNRISYQCVLPGHIPLSVQGEILLTPSHRFTVTSDPYQQDGFCMVDMVQHAGELVAPSAYSNTHANIVFVFTLTGNVFFTDTKAGSLL